MTCSPITDDERRLLHQLAAGLPIDDGVRPETLDELVKEGFLYFRAGG